MFTNSTRHQHEAGGSLRRRLTLFTSAAALGVAVGIGGAYAVAQQSTTTVPAQVQQQAVVNPAIAPAAGFADLVARVKPAVISVRVKINENPQNTSMSEDSQQNPFQPGTPFWQFFHRFGNVPGMQQHRVLMGQGSGFFISADGYAVTNNHVVANATSVEVITDSGKHYDAKVIGTDPKTDLALIKVDGKDFPFVRFADHAPRVGDWVVAIGNPFGLGGTVTAGIVSAEGRDIGSSTYDNFIQIDAPINKGNSGGPAFDLSGNVVGINTAIFSPSGGSVGIGFDIPAETAKAVIAQLMKNGHVTRGWLGVQVQTMSKDVAASLDLKTLQGALVDEAQPASPASKAGLKAGDVITAVNGAAVKDSRDLAQKIGAMAPGSSVKLDVLRNGTSQQMQLTLAEMPNQPQMQQAMANGNDQMSSGPRLGLQLAPADQVNGAGQNGVAVMGIDPNGPAANSGLRTGDVILSAAGKKVANVSDVKSAIARVESEGRKAILLRVKSGDNVHFVAVPLKKA